MQKLQTKKDLTKEEFQTAFFENLNSMVLKEPLSPKKLLLLKELYKLFKSNSFADLCSTEARKLLCSNLNISQSNLSTYFKEFKQCNLLVRDKETFVLNSGIDIKSNEVHFTKIIKLDG
jgi:hypothetical protein|tara:strand:- start:88 stop:444 length:357 start_codon:yes stop_codon:yes gene_type:complete